LSKCKRRKLKYSEKAEGLLNEAEKILAKLNGYLKFISTSPKHNKKIE
jgi:hypothetical protein